MKVSVIRLHMHEYYDEVDRKNKDSIEFVYMQEFFFYYEFITRTLICTHDDCHLYFNNNNYYYKHENPNSFMCEGILNENTNTLQLRERLLENYFSIFFFFRISF